MDSGRIPPPAASCWSGRTRGAAPRRRRRGPAAFDARAFGTSSSKQLPRDYKTS